ncbi:Protein TOS1 [Meyerozyma sp. JA9]|nr:Protein TOS1 [Meyerozyma sp. JA9]
MKFSLPILSAILASISTVHAACQQVDGNYYCSQTSKVYFEGVGFSGSYQDVTSMDESSGKCTQETYDFSGNLSPLNEELSVHFRGPLKLLQFGVYYPASGSNNKREDDEECVTQHVHHKHKRATQVVEVTQTVFVDGNGNTQTSQVAVPTSTGGSGASSGSGSGSSGSSGSGSSPSSSNAAPSASASSDSSSSAAAGDWERVSYYTPGNADNVTFLNYFGGSGSGVWSSAFGNSLSYANSDNTGGSSSPVALKEVTIPSNSEFTIMSSSKCSGNSCGFYREGIPAYHGFDGADKLFIFEFEMPSDTSGSSFNNDMPAIWMLNAKIPRTLQYGDASCSCWKTGCGELDLFEILSSGSDKLICHLHDGQGSSNGYGGGGSQDYFQRPTSGSMKAAVVFSGSSIQVVQVDDDTNFGSVLSSSTVSGWTGQSGSKASIGY